jgi:hypothetical protein
MPRPYGLRVKERYGVYPDPFILWHRVTEGKADSLARLVNVPCKRGKVRQFGDLTRRGDLV